VLGEGGNLYTTNKAPGVRMVVGGKGQKITNQAGIVSEWGLGEVDTREVRGGKNQ